MKEYNKDLLDPAGPKKYVIHDTRAFSISVLKWEWARTGKKENEV